MGAHGWVAGICQPWGQFFYLGAGWPQWKPLDIPGTHLPLKRGSWLNINTSCATLLIDTSHLNFFRYTDTHTILYHATYTWHVMMGRLGMIPWNVQRLSCILIGCIFSWHVIECFYSRVQQPCKFIGTKESVYIRKELNSHRIGLGH